MPRKKDRRKFKRYNSASGCEVVLSSGIYKGKIVDYSDGACILIENPPDVDKGMEINVRVFNHHLEFRGEVAWVVKGENTITAGIRRADNFRGNLRDFMLIDVLAGLNRCAKTGVLEIRSGMSVKKVFIDRGDLIFSASNNKDDRLGEHLLKGGKITLTEFEKASYLTMTTRKKLGEILVELSCLTQEELERAIRYHIEDIIFSLFPLESGELEFKEKPVRRDKRITLQRSTANIIYRGIKRISNFVFIKKICPSIDDVLIASCDPLRLYQSLSIDDPDKKLISYINGVYPLKTILSLSPLSNFETLKTISAFMTIGLIHVKKQEEAPAEFPVDEVFGVSEAVPPDYEKKIDQMLHKCENEEHYQILGITQGASIDDIRVGYSRLIKQFHPDRHLSFQSHDVKDKLMKIVSRATEAYEFLSDPDKKVIGKNREIAGTPEMPPALEGPPGTEEAYAHDLMFSTGRGPSEELEKEAPSVNFYNPLMADDAQAEEIMSSAGMEEAPLPVTGGDEETSVPVYELDTGVFESNQYETESDLTTGPLEDEPMTERKDTSVEKLKIEPEPPVLPEDIMLPEGEGEPVLEETAESGEKEPAPEHIREAEEITEADEQDEDFVIDHDARESVRSRKKWIYVPAILIFVILLGVAIPLVEDDIKEHLFFTTPVVSKKTDLPSHRDEAMKEISRGGAAATEGLPSFSEDVFKKLLHE